MKNSPKKTLLMVVAVILLLFLYVSFYTVQEGRHALLLRMGKLVADNKGIPQVINPGLHFKLPLIYQTRKIDTRLQTLDAQTSRVLTEEQKYLLVDYYVKWKIANLPLYYTRTGGFVGRAETLLQQKVNDALRAAFGKRTITEVVSGERGNVMTLLKNRADASAKGLGIKVVDVRIKGIDLPKEVSSSVFDRMRVEREQAATKHRSDGKAVAEAVRAKADATVVVTLATAKAKAAKIRARGIAESTKIYTNAYQKNFEFYSFYKSLEVYKSSFSNKKDILLLSPDSQFFKYFKNAKG